MRTDLDAALIARLSWWRIPEPHLPTLTLRPLSPQGFMDWISSLRWRAPLQLRMRWGRLFCFDRDGFAGIPQGLQVAS